MGLDSTKPTVQQTYGEAIESTRANFQDFAAHKTDRTAHGIADLWKGRPGYERVPSLDVTSLGIGGVFKTAWDVGQGGDGAVVLSGEVELGGAAGVTVTHNLGHTNYLVKLTPLADGGRVGEVWYTKASNTLVVYNTGQPRIRAAIEISNEAGMDTPAAWRWVHPGELEVMGQALLRNLVETQDLRPDADGSRTLGAATRRWGDGHFKAMTLGGVTRTAWPGAAGATNGEVIQSGALTLNGANGVTLTHNHGNTSYLVKVVPTGQSTGQVGEVSVVKAANTVTVYNTGRAGLPADFELSAIV